MRYIAILLTSLLLVSCCSETVTRNTSYVQTDSTITPDIIADSADGEGDGNDLMQWYIDTIMGLYAENDSLRRLDPSVIILRDTIVAPPKSLRGIWTAKKVTENGDSVEVTFSLGTQKFTWRIAPGKIVVPISETTTVQETKEKPGIFERIQDNIVTIATVAVVILVFILFVSFRRR